ncbi:hypothetical protein [Larkinella humicola]|uniref:DUF4177 domain-containing protein n=1 Tax=Larkinella humicola TaxID=2607654 RepID=A0A5N1JPE1_9BACT|nr:hypothetical protein [Larkinella humicola]KAA9355037.1 hypothetical protein F0P93_10670 [Larkinella humicola]
MMRILSTLLFLFVLTTKTAAQLMVNRVDVNSLDVQYCQLVCVHRTGMTKDKIDIYIDYGQVNFQRSAYWELRQIDSLGKYTERFGTIMQAVNYVAKNGWEVVSFQVMHDPGDSYKQFIYLMRKKQRQ